MTTKKCIKCKEEKVASDFYNRKCRDKTTLSSQCKECIRLKGKYALGYEKTINLPDEIWKDIPGYEGIYQSSNFCRVKSLERKSWNGFCWITQREIILKPAKNSNGNYYFVGLSKKSKVRQFGIHILTAMAFLGHVPCGFEIVVDHIDDNPENNTLSNLQLLTNRENIIKGFSKMKLTSKYTGVYFNKNEKKFRASICIKGSRQVHLGYFKEEIDAHNSYQTAFKNLDKYENDSQFRQLVKTLNQK